MQISTIITSTPILPNFSNSNIFIIFLKFLNYSKFGAVKNKICFSRNCPTVFMKFCSNVKILMEFIHCHFPRNSGSGVIV